MAKQKLTYDEALREVFTTQPQRLIYERAGMIQSTFAAQKFRWQRGGLSRRAGAELLAACGYDEQTEIFTNTNTK